MKCASFSSGSENYKAKVKGKMKTAKLIGFVRLMHWLKCKLLV